MSYRAELLTTENTLECVDCPMNKAGRICTTVAKAAVSGAVKVDTTYEPNDKVSVETEATILLDGSKNAHAARAAAITACSDLRSIYQQTATEPPMRVMS